LAPIMAKAKEKGIPVVTAGVGSPVENTITDINGDDALMATLASDALLSSIDYKGDVYIVWVPGAPLLETRKRIFEAICADYPDVKLHEVPTEHNPAKVQTQIEELMTANPDKGSIAGIFTTYDALMSGACSSIQKAGRGDEIKVVGIDGDIISFQMLFQKDGPFVASVVQDCNSIGKKAADIVIGVLDGTVDASSIKKKTSADSYVATRKNGIKAAEMKWTTNFWTDASLKKEDVEKDFPQSEDVMIEVPVLP
jgi:ribose transport system substrate-binding protein